MAVYGARTVTLGTPVPTPHVACDCCRRYTLFSWVTLRYAHVFGIPLRPIGKSIQLRCASCLRESEPRHSPALVPVVKRILASTRTPSWTYAGTIAAFVVLLLSVAGGAAAASRGLEHLAHRSSTSAKG